MNSKLNVKQWVTATVAVFVGMAIIEYIVHGVLLSGWYMEHPNYWRSQEKMMSKMHWMYMGYLVFAALFSYIYTRGYEGKSGTGEGMRYGMLVGALIGIPKMFIDHAVFYYPGKIVVGWGVSMIVMCTILGVIVGMIYKGSQQKTA